MSMLNQTIYYADKLSIALLGLFLKSVYNERENRVIFLSGSRNILLLYKLLKRSGILKVHFEKSRHMLCDMHSSSRSAPMRWEVEHLSSQFAVDIAKMLKTSALYKEAIGCLPQNGIDLYLEKMVRHEIYPVVRLLCIAKWNLDQAVDKANRIVLYPNSYLLSELHFVNSYENILFLSYRVLSGIRSAKTLVKNIVNGIRGYASNNKIFKNTSPDKSCNIAVHYAEGIDLQKRSDIFWYPDSKIEAKRVLIYIDTKTAFHKPVTDITLDRITSQGMEYICIDERAVQSKNKHFWKPERSGRFDLQQKSFEGKIRSFSSKLSSEYWLCSAIKCFFSEVDYWISFFKEFNVKIHIDIEEGGYRNIAQNVALQLTGGITVRKQRSYFFEPFGTLLGHYPSNVFFAWNDETPKYLHNYRNRIDHCLISGFPNDRAFKKNALKSLLLKEELSKKGANFTVALFDNVFNENIHFSKKMIESLYKYFLKWVLEDKEVAVIMKPKKPQYLKQLESIGDLFARAKATGRCVILNGAPCRLPSDASHAANIAVGAGISSAVMEAVIAGSRGVHCDLPKHHFHDFYKWGAEKIIFDDIDKLMKALKRFKENPINEPKLGEWASHINKLDPFRDGRSGERVGVYMRWLLESFDKGELRDEAMQYANRNYKKRWGENTVIAGPLEVRL